MPKKIILNNEKICQLYKTGFSSVKIAKEFKISKPTVLRRLKENGIKMRRNCFKRQFDFDDNIFSEFTPESCYWAGFIAADGCISNGTLSIELNIKDEIQLIKFCEFLGRKPHFYYRERRGHKYCHLGIRSKQVINDLKNNFNIIPNKTLILEAPHRIPNCLIRYYISGYFDGDGSISSSENNYRLVFVSGNIEILKWIKRSIKESVSVGNPKIQTRKTNCFCLEFKGNGQVPVIMNWMKDLKIYNLKRKNINN